jgi:FlaA1/EpsC-like NDP-sugar epimerase
MTIPEAVSLVLQAMSMGRDGEVFVLDMGDPIRILDLAESVIRLSGYAPYRDIEILETSIRPGEKLFEEILTNREDFTRTSHERLFIAKQDRLAYGDLGGAVPRLQRAVRTSDWGTAIAIMREFVPEFSPGDHLSVPDPVRVAVERDTISASNGKASEEVRLITTTQG